MTIVFRDEHPLKQSEPIFVRRGGNWIWVNKTQSEKIFVPNEVSFVHVKKDAFLNRVATLNDWLPSNSVQLET